MELYDPWWSPGNQEQLVAQVARLANVHNKKQIALNRHPNSELNGWALGPASFYHAEVIRQPRAVPRMVLKGHRGIQSEPRRDKQNLTEKIACSFETIHASQIEKRRWVGNCAENRDCGPVWNDLPLARALLENQK